MAAHDDAHLPGTPMGAAERAAVVLIPASALAVVLWLLFTQELPLTLDLAWAPALGLEFALRVDGLAALMLLMITGVGTAVFVYAGGYLEGHPQQRRLIALLTAFMIAMIGCVTADHMIVLFMFWEATSLLSFALVGFHHERLASRKSAQQSLLVTGTGGLALLAGFIVLAQALGTWRISEAVQLLPAMDPTPQLYTALALILAGAFTKSAQFPFHFWLPNAMAAPTPVSAYLHSATMVKLGVYLLARLDPGFNDWAAWEWTLKLAGSVTAAWGMVLALRERDLKRILAWSTVATLGTLVMLVGLRGEGAAVAVGALLLAHALYKAPLFFVAGNIDHGTGTRVIDKLGNLRHAMPWTAAAALLAGASMAGMPLSFGYIVKDVIMEAKSTDDVFAFARAANTVFGAIAVAVAGVAAIRVFWRHPGTNETPAAHECGPSLLAPPLALASIGIVLGLFPFMAESLIAQASDAMTPDTRDAALGLALEIGPSLLSLLVTLGIGVVVYLLWDPLHHFFERGARRAGNIGMAAHYERSLLWIPRIAAGATRTLQGGHLPTYMALTVGSVSAALVVLLVLGWGGLAVPSWDTPSAGFLGGCLLVCLGAAFASVLRDRLVLLLATGLVGYGSAVIFLYAGAPDVAFTQFTVETVFVIVVASVLLQLKRLGRPDSLPEPGLRPGAFVVASAFGGAVTLLLLVATAGAFDPTLSQYFGEKSVAEAYGRNVVNVILVDFRALDTLGEIAVVMLSFLAALPLLQALVQRRRTAKAQAGQPATNTTPGLAADKGLA
jgi:multicomponent Na+:H+ antiporter subunit A